MVLLDRKIINNYQKRKLEDVWEKGLLIT